MQKFKLKTQLLALFAWLLCGLLVLLQLWPSVGVQWRNILLVLVLGPPLYGALEYAGGWLLSEKNGQAVSSKKRSALRLLVTLVVVLIWMGIAWWFAAQVQ